jgi:hypothetical protein
MMPVRELRCSQGSLIEKRASRDRTLYIGKTDDPRSKVGEKLRDEE